MKPVTMLLVAFGFGCGLAIGLSVPLANAGNGLAHIWTDATPAPARAVRITASVENLRDGFQPADFRWSAGSRAASVVICTPKDDVAHAPLPGIQHL